MANVYLASYKAKGDWVDRVIRLTTGEPYSHSEIVIREPDGYYWYSSSPRDGGVRCKKMPIAQGKWDFKPLPHVKAKDVRKFYQRTKGKPYDYLGAVGCVLPLHEIPSRYYCSEWCFEAIFGYRPNGSISPNELATLLKGEDK